MKRSEYSQLRARAEKRIERLEKAGYSSPVKGFPTLRELSSADFRKASRQLEKFLSSKRTTVRGARQYEQAQALREYQRAEKEERKKTRYERLQQEQIEGRKLLDLNPKELTAEQKQIRRRYQNRIAKRKQRAGELGQKYGWDQNEQNLYRAALTLGLKINPAEIKDFADYVEVRHDMQKESAQYYIDKYAEDYDKLLQKGLTPKQITEDFQAYQKERAETMQDADELKNAVSYEDMENFINSLLEE